MDQLETTVMMLDQGGAALDPVAVIAVVDAVDHRHLGRMDVAADHTVGVSFSGLAHDSLFEIGDELHRFFDPAFQKSGQRPVGQSELSAQAIEMTVEPRAMS